MKPFGSHHRARTAPSSSSSLSDETLPLPLRLASHFPIQPQPQSRSGQHLTVPTWQPTIQYNIPTSVYKHNTPPAKLLRTRSTPVQRIDLGFIPLPRNNKGPLASDKPLNFEKIRKAEAGHFEYMDMDSDGGWDKENIFNLANPIAYNQPKSYTFKPQHLELITSMDPMNPVDQDSPPVISATSLDLYLNDVHPTQTRQPDDDRHLPRHLYSPEPETASDLHGTFDRSHNHLDLDEHHNRNLDDHYDLNNHYLDEHHELDDYYGPPQHDHNDYDDDTHTYTYNHKRKHTHTHEHSHNYTHDRTQTSPILLPTPSPTLSEHTRRRLSYGDPHPQPDYSIFGMIDRILTPKMRTPDRLVMPSVNGEGEVLLLDRAFSENEDEDGCAMESGSESENGVGIEKRSRSSPFFFSSGRMEIKNKRNEFGVTTESEYSTEREERRSSSGNPCSWRPATPDQSTSGTIRTGENGILLTPGDKEGMTGLGIVCRPRSGSGYFAPTPASISTPEARMGAGNGSEPGSVFGSAGSVARRRVLTFSREEQEDDTYNPIEPDNLVLKSSFQSRSTQHERYRTTSSAYALPAPVNRNRKKHNNGGNGRAYRQRMGKYPFNNPFARILFFSTVVILLAALFGVGGFVDDGADAGVAEYDLWMRGGKDMGMRGIGYGDGNQLRGWSGMVGDDTQVFGIVGLPATPSGGISGDVFYGEQQPIQDHYESSYSHLENNDEEEEKDKGYKLHKRRVHQHNYKKNGWRAKVRRAGAALHSHAEE